LKSAINSESQKSKENKRNGKKGGEKERKKI